MFALPPASGEPVSRPKPPSIGERLGLDLLNEAELVRLRADIEKRLPVKALRDLSLERELVLQLITVQNLQAEVLACEQTPANQQAQAANTVAATLTALIKLQAEIYTPERLKKIEQVLIECLQALPNDVQTAFLEKYEAALEDGGL